MAYDDDNYEDILERSWDEIPSNVVLPVGSYRLKASGANYIKPKSAEQNPQILFTYTVKEPLEDVDPEEIAQLSSEDITGKKVFHKVWLETGADWDSVRKHMSLLGIAIEGRTLKESFKDVKGHEVIAYLGVKTFKTRSGETVTDNQPEQFAAVED